jgi:hypothetical protein
MFVIQLLFRCKVISKLAYNVRIEKELYESARPWENRGTSKKIT